MNDNLKTILAFVFSICILIISFATAVSVAERGVAEFRFSKATVVTQATCTSQLGFSVWGYRIEVLQENK